MIKKLTLKKLLLFTFVFVFIFGLSFDANAQRRRSKSKRARVAAAKKKANEAKKLAALEIRKGAEDVAIQIKNVSKFVFVLGGIAKGIEEIDKDLKEGKAGKNSREVARKNEEFKSNVIRSIRALRAGLVKLEVDFRAKPKLRKYLINIQGITTQSARVEDFALAGRFNRSGKELLLIVETLTDVLVAMP